MKLGKLLDIREDDRYLFIITDKGEWQRKKFDDTPEVRSKCESLKGKNVEINVFRPEEWKPHKKNWFNEIWEDAESGQQENKAEQSSLLPVNQNFDSHSSQKIFGPPGTGKTTTLINYVVGAVGDEGVEPKNIAFISFTNAAANVAKQRVAKEFPDRGSIEFPNFSTMHSLATRISSPFGKDLVKEKHIKAFDKSVKCEVEYTQAGDPMSIVDRFKHPIMDIYSLSINRCEPLNETFERIYEDDERKINDLQDIENDMQILLGIPPRQIEEDVKDFYWRLVAEYCKQYEAYKEKNRLLDFNDVIANVVASDFPDEKVPTFELLIIDEAQDLSKHLWQFAKRLIKNAKTVYIAGDDDQAIMASFGAAPEEFIAIEATLEDNKLIQSYRIPKSVRAYVDLGAMSQLRNLKNRIMKEWLPSKKAGEVQNNVLYQEPGANGEVGIKVRNFEISDLVNKIENDVNLIKSVGGGGVSGGKFMALSGDENVIKSADEGQIFRWLIMAPTKDTGENLSKHLKDKEIVHYYRNRLIGNSNGYKDTMLEWNPIHIKTIHTAKGEEATYTAIIADAFGDVMLLTEDIRVAYVALTRAKHTMYPRVIKKGLLPDMKSANKSKYRKAAQKYMEIFPIDNHNL